MFHKHRWVTTGVKFNPPVSGWATAEVHGLEMVLALTVGFTNVTQTCSGCGRAETTRCGGKMDVEVAETARLIEAPR